MDDDELLWRRVHPDYYVPTADGSGFRVSTGAFKTKELSIDRVAVLQTLGLGVEFTAQTAPGVAELPVAALRSVDLEPEPDEIPPGDRFHPEGNPAHAIVRSKIREPQAKVLVDKSVFRPNPNAISVQLPATF